MGSLTRVIAPVALGLLAIASVGLADTNSGGVQIVTPSAGQVVAGVVPVTVTVRSDVQWVNFYIDDDYRSSSPPYTYNWNASNVNGGRHTISVNAYNASHQLVGQALVSVNVASPAAANAGAAQANPVSLTAPANGAAVSGTVTIDTTASPAVQWVNLYIDGNYYASSPPDEFTWDSTGAGDGAHTITMRGYNSADQEIGSDSATVNVEAAAPTPAPTPASDSTAASTDTNPSSTGDGQFVTLPPGSSLPSDQECAMRVAMSSWEPRPDNDTANHTTPTSDQLAAVYSSTDDGGAPQSYFQRVTGNFTGTTDEILQWGACKWGFDVDLVRAIAANESWWHQSAVGDNGVTYGILQIKSTDYPATVPMSQTSTAFNVDWKLAYQRACFEGQIGYLKSADYPNSDSGNMLWGCVGQWYSGQWYDSGAQTYIAQVQNDLDNKVWQQPGF